MWVGGATGNVDIHGQDLIDSTQTGVILTKDAAAAAAGANGDDEAGRRHCIIGLVQSELHVASDGSGDQQHVRVARGSDKVDAEPFDVIDRAVEAIDLDLAAVARSGIHFANMQ